MTANDAPGVTLVHVDYDDVRAAALRRSMDAELQQRYTTPGSPEFSAAAQAALVVDRSTVQATVLALDADGAAVGHGALRLHDGNWEVKRVIVDGDQRGRGIGRALMIEMERVARAAGARRLILQTGDRQPEAVRLYERLGYTPIASYEPYASAMPTSLCFEKSFPEC